MNRRPLLCWFGYHDDRPLLEPSRIFAVCAGCGRHTEGWDLDAKPLKFIRPRDGQWNRLRWYQHLNVGFDRFMEHKGSGTLLRRVK